MHCWGMAGMLCGKMRSFLALIHAGRACSTGNISWAQTLTTLTGILEIDNTQNFVCGGREQVLSVCGWNRYLGVYNCQPSFTWLCLPLSAAELQMSAAARRVLRC